ncbi:MAG: NAD-dependent epimerase/dehydratase family protein [Ginsengibacter sp.]
MKDPNDTPADYPLKDSGITLVTGGSGLVGAELITHLLAADRKVRAIYNHTPLPDFKSENVTAVRCDILDTSMLEAAMEGITKVYHCAAIVSFSKKLKNEVYAVNIEGTTNVVNECINAGVKKMLHVSSVASLGSANEGENITEDSAWTEKHNNSFYGRSKFLAEMEVWRGIGEGLQAVIVNPSTILGGADWNRSSSKIFKTAFEEFPWYSQGITGFVDVRDVVKAMILLMDSEITNQRFILSAENISYKQIFTDIANGFGKKAPHKKVTPFIAGMVWRMEALKSFITGKEHLLNKETAHKALNKSYYDNSKIKKNLHGFSFRPIKETINDTCAALQQLTHTL